MIQKQDKCTLLDNSNRTKWRVQTQGGQQGSVPSVCFLLPPPDQEALEAIERLKRQYEMSLILWQRKQLRMRQNMILATIKVVKSWDLQQVRSTLVRGQYLCGLLVVVGARFPRWDTPICKWDL